MTKTKDSCQDNSSDNGQGQRPESKTQDTDLGLQLDTIQEV